jgi:hypothetical protein
MWRPNESGARGLLAGRSAHLVVTMGMSAGSNGASSDSPAWRPSVKPCWGWSMRRAMPSGGVGSTGWETTAGASSELGSTRQRAARDVQQSSRPSCSRKWPWKSGNGGVPGFFAFSACRLEMIFSSPVENQGARHFRCPACPPTTGTAGVGRRRPTQAVGAFGRGQVGSPRQTESRAAVAQRAARNG